MGFFPYLSKDSLFESFARLYATAGQSPIIAVSGLVSHHEDFIVPKYGCTNSRSHSEFEKPQWLRGLSTE